MKHIPILVVLMMLLAACAQIAAPLGASVERGEAQAAPADTPRAADKPTSMPVPTSPPTLLPEERPPAGATAQFRTDFGKHSVPYSEFLSGGPPKDGIPAIDEPRYTSIEAADEWLESQEPVILVEIGTTARAYPIQILMWHEIVNDTLGGAPIAVTFCPLCNTAIAFERRIDDKVTTFGTTGRLRFSNLVMYDRLTESWWQQATGEGLVGEYTGRQLTFLPAAIISWEAFKEAHPEADVLSRATGYSRSYGRNPYAGYDDIDRSPFLYDGPETPDQLLPMARVATVDLNGEAVAYPYTEMAQIRTVNDVVGGKPIVVLWEAGTASALDSFSVAQGRDVGTVNTFARELEGRTLTFRYDGERIVDEETGSEWTVLGRAISGPLDGKALTPVVNVNHFWFSWAAFRPETRIYRADATSLRTDEGLTDDSTASTAESVSVELPFDFDINVYQGAEVLGGEQIRFSDAFRPGKPVVAVMWAGLCPTCRRELPEIQEAYEAYGDRITFIGIDIGPFVGLGFEEEGRALLKELNVTFPAGGPPDGQLMREYRILGSPSTLFFSADGEVVTQWSGLLPRDRLTKEIEELLGS
jgi:thiol-disulfide isomerase/thioredoxin